MAVTCSVAATEPAAFDDVVERCRRAGLEVAERLGAIGVVTGTVDESALARLAAVPGVTAVERARSVQLGDPDAPVQ